MFYLFRLLDETKTPLDPEIPLIFGSGVLTGFVPSASRGNATSWSPESGVLMDSNCGDYFPSFLKMMTGIDHLILFGRAPDWTMLRLRRAGATDEAESAGPGVRVEFIDAEPYVGLDNIDMRERVAADLGGTWERDLAMVNITRAGEHLVLTSGIMGGPKAIYARGGPGAKMGSLKLKAIVIQGAAQDMPTARPYKPLQSRDRDEAARHVRREARAEDGGHAVPLQAEPAARRDGHEEQPGDDLDRSAGRESHRSVSRRHGRAVSAVP